MLQIRHSNALVQQLTARLAGNDSHWFIDLSELLEIQSDETLTDLLAATVGYTEHCYGALSKTLHTFVHGGDMPDNTNLVKSGLSRDEFALRVAFSLVPVAVMRYEPMIGEDSDIFVDDMEGYTEKDMFESVTSAIYGLMSDLLPEEDSLSVVRACYLITLYGRRHKVPMPSNADFLWIQDHALEIMPHHESVFKEGVFDRELAEALLEAEPALREGVL